MRALAGNGEHAVLEREVDRVLLQAGQFDKAIPPLEQPHSLIRAKVSAPPWTVRLFGMHSAYNPSRLEAKISRNQPAGIRSISLRGRIADK